MDHLPTPSLRHRRNEDTPHPSTRLLSDVHSDLPRVPFNVYPHQRGMSMDVLLSGSFDPEQSHHAAALVQNWLFFGLIEKVFGIKVTSTDLTVKSGNGNAFLHTKALCRYRDEWFEQTSTLGNEVKQEEMTRLRNVFRTCTRFFQLYALTLHSIYPSGFSSYFGPLAVLMETLQLWKGNAFAIYEPVEPLPANLSSNATQDLIDAGWCPWTIQNIISASSSPSCLAYAGKFQDKPRFVRGAHSICSANRCTLATVDTSTYETEHREFFCTDHKTCGRVFPDVGKIEDLLKKDQVPVMILDSPAGLSVINDLEQPYVAISHVWADGMGSTSEQGLWSCQLDFLSEAATAAYNYIHETNLANVPFWVDSICVPKQHDLRQKAIVLMAQSYEDAAAVVVTDRMLLELSLEDSIEEQLFVLYISNWIQRMWTLPEALLSKHHLFRLRDGLVDVRSYFASEILAEHFQNPIGSKLLGWVAQFMAMPFLKSAG